MNSLQRSGFIILLLVLCAFTQHNTKNIRKGNISGVKESIIKDCNFTLAQALKGTKAPKEILNNLTIVTVTYYSFDGRQHSGQLVIHKALANDIKTIFQKISDKRFPVSKVIPVSKYNWVDTLSMNDNNTSCFNYRKISGAKALSKHSYGRAIDINPFLNPRIKNGKSEPYNAKYIAGKPGVFSRNNVIVNEFIKLGWKWGGNWKLSKDYQHFEK
jgi:hypothetical protein